MRKIFFISSFLILFLSINLYSQKTSTEFVKECWQALSKRKFNKVYELVDECIKLYGKKALEISKSLKDFPPKGKESLYNIMNDVATCLFIKGEALMREGRNQEAKEVFKKLIKDFPYAQSWDPRGWWWKIAEKSKLSLDKLEKGILEEELKKPTARTKVILFNPGKDLVDYEKYGEFLNEGTQHYKYKIKDLAGLIKAVGEGVWPNTRSFMKNPRFKIVKNKKAFKKLNHWQILNTQDLETAFFKWCIAPESEAVKQFFRAQILERSGLIKQAIKGYYAILVHFPKSYGWTYWHTPWYLAKVCATRIKYLISKHPELNMKFEGCKIKIINGFDNDVSNDIFIISPGRIKRVDSSEKVEKEKKRELGKIIEERTKGKIRLVKYESGDWQLLVDGKPFLIKAVTYSPTRVGESPDEGTLRNWTKYDYNNNRIIDCFEVFVDKNKNNKKDPDEEVTSDFALMKEMGVNAIRIYHQPFKLNKKVLREMYQKYKIYVLMGDFLGKYALGSGADWFEGTDYDNPEHQKNMIESVKKMVLEFKDEPYILAWILGNENNYGIACNADKKPESFYKFANRVAGIIKEIDPYHPVILCNGDTLYLDIFAKYCDNIDIFGTNAYRGKYGFGFLWQDVKDLCDKPVLITEYGAPAFGEGYTLEEAEAYQAEYHKSCWQDILRNSAGSGCGNALGGVVFEWVDEWWKAYEPSYHDKKGVFSGPFLDGYMHEEWLGICSQGDGKNSPFLRQLRKVYYTLKELWKEKGGEVK